MRRIQRHFLIFCILFLGLTPQLAVASEDDACKDPTAHTYAPSNTKIESAFRSRHRNFETWAENAQKLATERQASTYCMTIEEAVALFDYSNFDFAIINQALRNPMGYSDLIPKLEPEIKTLIAGLSRLPDFQGIVFRGTEFPADILEQHQIGKAVTYAAFTSTSKSSDIIEHYFKNRVWIQIRSKHGKSVSELSHNDWEEEVLFLPGTRFLVRDRRLRADGVTELELEEID
jgi:hypothetical protein